MGDFSLLVSSREAEAPSAQQRLTSLYATQAEDAHATLQELHDRGFTLGTAQRVEEYLPRGFQSEDYQRYEQAMKIFVNAYLRRTSGAAISKQEMIDGEAMFFPQVGNPEGVLAQKKRTRETVLQGLYAEAGEIAMNEARLEIDPTLQGILESIK